MKPKYHRVLLKLSGEALAGPKKTGLDAETMLPICKSIKKCVDAGVEMGIVVGGVDVPARTWTAPEQTTSECWQPQ